MRLAIPILLSMALKAFIACGPEVSQKGKEGAPAVPAATTKGEGPTKGPDPPKPTPWPAYTGRLERCYTLNIFTITTEEGLTGMSWCHDALIADTDRHCGATHTTETQLAFGRERLGGVYDPATREMGPCINTQDPDDRAACVDEAFDCVGIALDAHLSVLPEIQSAVDDHADIKQTRATIGDCTVENYYERTSDTYPMPWQVAGKMEQRAKPDRSLTTTDQQRQERIARWKVLDRCAEGAGLYERQDELWLEEVLRLQREYPERIRLLIEQGLKVALDMEGPMPSPQLYVQLLPASP